MEQFANYCIVVIILTSFREYYFYTDIKGNVCSLLLPSRGFSIFHVSLLHLLSTMEIEILMTAIRYLHRERKTDGRH